MAPPDTTPRIYVDYSYSIRNSVICSIIVALLYLWVGSVFTWSSPQLLRLQSELHTSAVEDTVIVTSFALGATLGPAVGAVLVNRWGGKSVVWLHVCVLLGSSCLLIALPLLPFICVGRALAGVAVGASLSHLPAYLEDILDPGLLSMLMPWLVAAETLGYSADPDWYVGVAALCLCGVIGVAALAVLPQSPRHDVATGHLPRAHASIQFLERGISTSGVEARIREIQERISREEREQSNDALLLSSSPSLKALYLALVLTALASLTGASAVLTVLCHLMQEAHSFGGPTTSAGLVNSFVFIAAATVPYCYCWCGHKKILIGSAVVMTLSMIIFGLYLTNLKQGIDLSNLQWLPILCVFVNLSAFKVGLAAKTDEVIRSLCWNSKLKRFGTILASTVGFLCMFLVTLAYFSLRSLFGITTIMWIFAFFSFLTAVFVQVFIPETKGMSPEDMENFLH